jgi:hypothetical protein
VASACAFRHGAAPGSGGDAGGDSRNDGRARDAGDGGGSSALLWASDSVNLYTVDPVSQTFAVVGPLHYPSGSAVPGVDAFASRSSQLIGISRSGSGQAVVTIDPATAEVTFFPPLVNPHDYYGCTYDGDTDQVLAGTADDGNLYSIDVNLGTATLIGSFGNGMHVYGDIAWMAGAVYGTMVGGPCAPGCIATINPTTGAATPLSTDAPGALPSIGVFGGHLYAFSGSGDVYAIDSSTGSATYLYNAGGKDFGDTAP